MIHLSPAEAAAIDAHVAALEARTGTQVVVAVTGKADSYLELPWTAFALGASLAALALVIAEAWRPDWATGHAALRVTVTILGAGAASALASVFVPAYARLFLRPTRRDLEVRQYAQSLFLERELYRTRERTAVLLLVSLFERKIELLPDTGCRDRVKAADWEAVVARMTPLLRDRRAADALHAGLDALGDALARNGFRAAVTGDVALSNRPMEEQGPAGGDDSDESLASANRPARARRCRRMGRGGSRGRGPLSHRSRHGRGGDPVAGDA